MPANEQTWRTQSLLHIAFGVSALAMLLATIWMLAADHNREWKKYQREFRKIDAWQTQARIDQERTTDFLEKEEELKKALEEAKKTVPPKALIDEFTSLVKSHSPDVNAEPVQSAYETFSKDPSVEAYAGMLSAIDVVVREAKRVENNASRALRFRRADLDVVRSSFDQAVGEDQPRDQINARQAEVNKVQAEVDQLALDADDAKTYRINLEKVVAQITAGETKAQAAINDHKADLDRLSTSEDEATLSWAENLLTLPILDAFGRPLSIDQIWLPDLTINYNFRNVPRFDRCITCHRAIDKTAPGSAVDPGFEHQEVINVSLATPAERPEIPADGKATDKLKRIEDTFGLRLAHRGIDPTDVTIELVWPGTPAAMARLETGDVIAAINDVALDRHDLRLNTEIATNYLWDLVAWGQPIKLTVRRGVPHPYSSHPKLDLFVGPLSPHKMMEVGCTICHDGQGSATDFKWASHTPNNPQQEAEWATKYGWFDNHHWLFPMTPERFVESNCLKCHYDVTALEPSDSFPDAPADKLVAGFNLVRQYGCFGCHEINGFNGPTRRIGPDLRLEPQISAAAAEVLADPGLTDPMREVAQKLYDNPTLESDRKLLAEMIRTASAEASQAGDGAANLAPATKKMADILGADYEAPGEYRKVGPSLRYLASKLDLPFLYSWIREPKAFRPNTRMPQFFGLYDHLLPVPMVDEQGHQVMEEHVDADGNVVEVPEMTASPGMAVVQKFEPVEIRAASEYLLSVSQPFEYIDPPGGTEAADVERGKKAFQLRGCLACHQHKDFPEATATQGPDLSRIGAKLSGEKGTKWLYSWVREPNRYHSRTVMPNLFLETITEADGKVTDPASDITAYLLSNKDWEVPSVPQLVDADLDALALEWLRGAFTAKQAEQYLAEGIPEALVGELKGDEVLLVAPITREKKLAYVGRRTIGKYGCMGCHDVPGFEDAKPIGTALADWGRKDTSRLAFEQIVPYLERTENDGAEAQAGGAHGGHGAKPLNINDIEPDKAYFVEALLNHRREGFLWQKLRAPRSYDYEKTENKRYNEWLRMPKFPFDDEQVEQIMTFVLGLVAEPPADKYVYRPDGTAKAIAEGRQVLDKYNCGGCHILEMEKWKFDYDPQKFEDPPSFVDFAFTIPHFSPATLEASQKTDDRGLGSAIIVGQQDVDETGQPVEVLDEDDNPLAKFNLWESVPINGQPWVVGVTPVLVSNNEVTERWPVRGGDLARWLYPAVVADAKQSNPAVKVEEGWGWLPPPLLNEGLKVQTSWLHNFLLDPYRIRPAVVLRMPKFNMSSDEASKLVAYFSAMDRVEFPYEFDPRTRPSHLEHLSSNHPHRLEDALKLVTDRKFCVQCHYLGDFVPEGAVQGHGPRLDQVHNRLRPDFLRAWIASPKRLLPYTGMPVNFPPDREVAQEIYKGDSLDQTDAVVDLLLNFDEYMKQKTSIKVMVPPATPEDQPAAAGAEAGN